MVAGLFRNLLYLNFPLMKWLKYLPLDPAAFSI